MDFETAIRYMKKVKELGFRDQEIEIPIPEEEEVEAEIPSEENFDELLDSSAASFHQSILLSKFQHTIKGSFAFSALSQELANITPKPKKGKDAFAFMFTKIGNGKPELIEEIKKNPFKAFDMLPEKATHKHEITKQFCVHGDGKNVHCFIKFHTSWRKIFSIPYEKGIWHIPENEFVAAYALGKNIHGLREFNPSLENILYAATKKSEYGWLKNGLDVKGLVESANSFAEIYTKYAGTIPVRYFKEFLVLSGLMRNAALVQWRDSTMFAPEFFANVPYMLARVVNEKNNGNNAEALYLLRSVKDLALLPLRCAPFEGKMLALTKYFDQIENLAGIKFVLEPDVVGMLTSLGVDFADAEKNFIKLKEGKDFFVHNGKISVDFGTLLSILHTISIFRQKIEQKTFQVPELWKELRSQNAKLFVASYDEGAKLSLLESETQIARGSDVIKVEEFFSRIVVKRAMVCESGKAKEIKPHLTRIIELADKKSLDEKSGLEEMGSWGECVYEISTKGKKAVLALLSAKKFY